MAISNIKKKTIICPQCGTNFTPNHGNRKHCNDQCKIDYSNANAKHRRQTRAKVDNILKNNFNILEKILGNQTEVTRSIEFMRGAGFDFNRYTHMIEYNGKQCRGVYEFIIALPDTQTIKIIKNV